MPRVLVVSITDTVHNYCQCNSQFLRIDGLLDGMNTTSARWLRGVAVTSGLMTAVVLSPAAGPASADPITSALATTTCSYAQINSALNAQAPDLATRFNNRPQMQNRLQQFLALPIDQRQQRVAEQQAANPQMAQFIASQIGPQGLQAITQVVNTCQNY